MEFVCPYCEAAVDPGDPAVLASSRCTRCGEPISLPGQLGARMAAAHASALGYDAEAEAQPAVCAQVVRDLGVDNPGENLVGVHYLYDRLIGDYLARADRDAGALLRAIEACKQQISLAARVAPALRAANPALGLPAHAGYEQLCALRERQRLYEEATALAQQAQAEGWAGPWEQLIARCKKTTIHRRSKPV